MRPIRVLLVEDNDVFREALELLLGLRPDTEVVGAVSDGTEAAAACARTAPDVVLVDYRLPALDGVETTAAIRSRCPDAAVLCLTADITPGEEEAVLAAGAVECVSKDSELDEIVAAIGRAAGGVSLTPPPARARP
jgi:DNA-binding NarL/FixJ family response regulator